MKEEGKQLGEEKVSSVVVTGIRGCETPIKSANPRILSRRNRKRENQTF